MLAGNILESKYVFKLFNDVGNQKATRAMDQHLVTSAMHAVAVLACVENVNSISTLCIEK